ncbi:MAG: flagellar basal body P-ring formation chaperone FlgA [Planctomycetes bacterium]|nr:flagellar basal body P-ring formation chaperone FlgA [Planctomycetota bacterium]
MLTLQLLLLAGGVSVDLPTEAEATGTMITLGEIAEVTGDDPSALAAINAVELGYMPAPGYSRTLQRWKIERAVSLAAPGVEVNWAGEKACRVYPAVEMISATALYETARVAVAGLFEGEEVTIKASGTISDVSVPRGAVRAALRADLTHDKRRPGNWSVPVRVLVDGTPYHTAWIGLEVELYQELPVLLESAPKGTKLSAAMFAVRRVRVEDTNSQPLALSLLSDAVAVRAIPAGHVVTERDVDRPLAVNANAPVWIEVVNGHIRASVLGNALQSGRIGDLVTVRIEATGKEIQATVTGRDQVTRELKRAR